MQNRHQIPVPVNTTMAFPESTTLQCVSASRFTEIVISFFLHLRRHDTNTITGEREMCTDHVPAMIISNPTSCGRVSRNEIMHYVANEEIASKHSSFQWLWDRVRLLFSSSASSALTEGPRNFDHPTNKKTLDPNHRTSFTNDRKKKETFSSWGQTKERVEHEREISKRGRWETRDMCQ